jgi:hypothetical protein
MRSLLLATALLLLAAPAFARGPHRFGSPVGRLDTESYTSPYGSSYRSRFSTPYTSWTTGYDYERPNYGGYYPAYAPAYPVYPSYGYSYWWYSY